VLSVFLAAVFHWQRRVVKLELGLKSLRHAVRAAITAIHRVGSALNLNLHLHSIITDGVFAQSAAGDQPVFRALPIPRRPMSSPLRGTSAKRRRVVSWSELAKRTFDVDVTHCIRCRHSPTRVVAVVVAPTLEQLAMLGDANVTLQSRPERSRAPPPRQMRSAFARAAVRFDGPGLVESNAHLALDQAEHLGRRGLLSRKIHYSVCCCEHVVVLAPAGSVTTCQPI
jgi:hypothetical protein